MSVTPVTSSVPAAAPGAPSIDTSALIEALRSAAANILGSAVGASPLVGMQIGALGNMPYFWQSPRNLQFNTLTYGWINENLRANTTPLMQDQPFTNLYTQVLASIRFSLSSTDRAALNQAQANATDQQIALLNAWVQAFGSLPPATPPQQPIDVIMSMITNDWAVPPTNLMAIQQAPNLFQLLNNTPASGQPIVPVLANYLNALGATISLQNATTMNTGFLQDALKAVQTPTQQNGAITTDDGVLRPAYQVSTPLADILNGLKATSNAIQLQMSVVRSSASEVTVSIGGGGSFRAPIGAFFGVTVGGNASYFSDDIATSSNAVDMTMTFSGVTLVNFGPVAFDSSTRENWFWMLPVTQAIANGTADVTGFQFAPNPNIDFSTKGPFGFLEGAAISNYPSVSITVTSSQFEQIAQSFRTQTSVAVTFLGIPLASASASTYSSSVSTDAANQKVTITLNPPLELVAGTAVDLRGWVLGVQSDYPAATV